MGPNLKGLNLQNANIDGSLDLLIVADNYWDCVTGEIINHSPGPVALGSIFGWLVSGKSNDPIENSKYRICMVMHPHDIMSEDQYNREITNELDHSIKESLEEDPTYENFCNSIQKHEGRYSADLPWRSGLNVTSTNYFSAKKRLNSIISSLKKTENFDKYNDVIENYLSKDYIEVCPISETGSYLPHHAVIKQDRTTTKLRIVFDGSARTNQSLSLNECLYKGPIL